MTESERIAIIKNAVENATRIVPQQFKGLVEELKATQMTEDLIVEHGLKEATEEDVLDECESLEAFDSDNGEDEDFENDENLTDMDCVSGAMRDAFGE